MLLVDDGDDDDFDDDGYPFSLMIYKHAILGPTSGLNIHNIIHNDSGVQVPSLRLPM